MTDALVAEDQSVATGVIAASMVTAPEIGWLGVYHSDTETKSGPVVSHALLRAGETVDVTTILTEAVAPGDKLILIVNSGEGGLQTGIFEYTLGAVDHGPSKPEGKLVMTVITAQ